MFNFSIAVNDKNDSRYNINNIEVCDSYFVKPLNKLDGNELEDVRDFLIDNMTKIILYTSLIPVSDYDAYVSLFKNAYIIGVENIKLDASILGNPVDLESIKKIIAIGEAFSIKVVFEVTAERFEEFNFETYKEVKSDMTGLIYNPIEFVKLGKGPFLQSLYKAKYKNDIVILRINDMLLESLVPTHIEKGHSEVKECASCLLARSYKGYFSFSKYSDDICVCETVKEFLFALKNM